MRNRGRAMCCAVAVAVAGGAAAGDRDRPVLSVESEARHLEQGAADAAGAFQPDGSWIEPRMSPSMTEAVKSKLETAFAIAASRVAEVEACGALFSALETTGADMLSTTVYYQADPGHESSTCRRGSAFTWVGAAPTRVCRRFETLPDQEAAMVVIHEALHHAGLDERPRDRHAMTSRQINAMVREACGL